ncbi:hypothetical protein LCGC14_1760700 [marine sediment metagenome]|uniref:Uncharacterized protein n=1 Tax=marine sediment metagenome TaxID=412755 RepID=A0A0F9HNI5_9ZZZZ
MRIKMPENGMTVHGGEVEIDFNLATAFMEMDCDQQARFFEECAKIGITWGSRKYQTQLCEIAESLIDKGHHPGINMLNDIVKRL